MVRCEMMGVDCAMNHRVAMDYHITSNLKAVHVAHPFRPQDYRQ